MFVAVKEFCAGSYLPEEEDERYMAFIIIEAGSGKTVHLIKTGLKFSLFQVSLEYLPYNVLRPYLLLLEPVTYRVRNYLYGSVSGSGCGYFHQYGKQRKP
jgi:hypothetical protein